MSAIFANTPWDESAASDPVPAQENTPADIASAAAVVTPSASSKIIHFVHAHGPFMIIGMVVIAAFIWKGKKG
jgi:hypothetical protein